MEFLLALMGLILDNSSFFARYNLAMSDRPTDIFGLSLGYQSNFSSIVAKHEFTLLRDHRTGGQPIGFFQSGLGVEPSYGPFYIGFIQSVGVMTVSDSINSGYFQFAQDAHIGFKGIEGTAIQIGYKHISNLGISLPNVGRDMVTITVRYFFK